MCRWVCECTSPPALRDHVFLRHMFSALPSCSVMVSFTFITAHSFKVPALNCGLQVIQIALESFFYWSWRFLCSFLRNLFTLTRLRILVLVMRNSAVFGCYINFLVGSSGPFTRRIILSSDGTYWQLKDCIFPVRRCIENSWELRNSLKI
jgi:hypothetical protein